MAEDDNEALSESAYTETDSSVGDWDDYDDVPLTMLPDKPTQPQGLPAFAALALPKAHSPAPEKITPRLSRNDFVDAPSTSLATPDPCEPLPSSRTARRSVVTPLRLPTTEPSPSQQQGPGMAMPNIAMPKLSLPSGSTAGEGLHMRPPEPARGLSLPLQSQSSTQSSSTASTAQSNFVQVSLLSSAFCITDSLPDSNGSESHVTEGIKQQVVKRCIQALGVEPQMVQLYQVQDLQAISKAPPHLHVAVHVTNSTFSLAALEEQMKLSKDLQEQQSVNAKTINSMVVESQALHRENKQLSVDNVRQTEELKAEQAKNTSLQEEIMMLRSQLRASEEHRTRLQTTVKDLKRDFQRTLNGTMFAATGPVS